MVKKKALSIFIPVLLILSSCATQRRTSPAESAQTAGPQAGGPANSAVNPSASLPNPLVPQAPPPKSEQAPAPRFAVWIDGAGFDAVMALGFLQEMEKVGLKPAKVVGTGFGCWVALAWSLSNGGNRAEWQTFKLGSFDSLHPGGLLGKLTGSGAYPSDSVKGEIEKLYPIKDMSKLALPGDCPLVPKKPPLRFVSARSIDVPFLLWLQIQIPALGVSEDAASRPAWYSGVAAGSPLPDEMDAFSRELEPHNSSEHFAGWIVLRTRSNLDRAGNSPWGQAISERGDENMTPTGRTPVGDSWLLLDMVDNPQRPSDEIRRPDNRRRFLLDGRRKAQQILQHGDVKNFFESVSPH